MQSCWEPRAWSASASLAQGLAGPEQGQGRVRAEGPAQGRSGVSIQEMLRTFILPKPVFSAAGGLPQLPLKGMAGVKQNSMLVGTWAQLQTLGRCADTRLELKQPLKE